MMEAGAKRSRFLDIRTIDFQPTLFSFCRRTCRYLPEKTTNPAADMKKRMLSEITTAFAIAQGTLEIHEDMPCVQ